MTDVDAILQAIYPHGIRVAASTVQVLPPRTGDAVNLPASVVRALKINKGEIVRRHGKLGPAYRKVRAMEDAGRARGPQYDAALYEFLIELGHYEKACADALRYAAEVPA